MFSVSRGNGEYGMVVENERGVVSHHTYSDSLEHILYWPLASKQKSCWGIPTGSSTSITEVMVVTRMDQPATMGGWFAGE